MIHKRRALFKSLALTLAAMSCSALQAAGEKSVTIRGDTESPTVLYLVPWKEIPSSSGNTDFEMTLDFEQQPLSRSEVVRKVRYFKEVDYDKNVKTKVRKNLRVIRR